jgi:hypothetical protein
MQRAATGMINLWGNWFGAAQFAGVAQGVLSAPLAFSPLRRRSAASHTISENAAASSADPTAFDRTVLRHLRMSEFGGELPSAHVVQM